MSVTLVLSGVGWMQAKAARGELTEPTVATAAVPSLNDGVAQEMGSLTLAASTRQPVAKPTSTLKPTASVWPASHLIEGVPAEAQRRKLSCEFQSAADLAWYYGVPVEWQELFDLVGYSDTGDPQEGFAGASIDDTPGQLYPAGYGVYAEPIVTALQTMGLDAVSAYGQDEAWIQRMVAADRPVMVWAVAAMREGQVETWTTSDGRRIEGVRFEHTFLVVGYSPEQVTVLDAYDGKLYQYSWDRFLKSWSVLGRMAVVIE